MSCFSVSLRSGSSGNSTFVRTESARLLVDLGLNGKRLALALEEFDEDPDQVDAILLTHEHTDHVSGVGVVMRRHRIPLYTTLSTFNKAESLLGKIDYDLVHLIVPGNPFTVRDTEIIAFPLSHDAVDPVGFRISSKHGDVGVMTDTGEFDVYARESLKGCRVVYLESNYDEDMLWNGDYPYPLKVRIDSRSGHLSNDEAGQ
ncbi:MAG: MBL fold metallo-hydrolase, partial [Fastidiosipila sp.]|nr:MBL fold metallo-hydrolase [Fastidiosipila sp.]